MLNLTRPEGSEPQDFHVSRRAVAGLFFTGYAVAAFSAEAVIPAKAGIHNLRTFENMDPRLRGDDG
jgi:hypothetical protein